MWRLENRYIVPRRLQSGFRKLNFSFFCIAKRKKQRKGSFRVAAFVALKNLLKHDLFNDFLVFTRNFFEVPMFHFDFFYFTKKANRLLYSERLSLSTKSVAFWLKQAERTERWAPFEKSKFVLAKRANGESLERSTVQEENAANSQAATKSIFDSFVA